MSKAHKFYGKFLLCVFKFSMRRRTRVDTSHSSRARKSSAHSLAIYTRVKQRKKERTKKKLTQTTPPAISWHSSQARVVSSSRFFGFNLKTLLLFVYVEVPHTLNFRLDRESFYIPKLKKKIIYSSRYSSKLWVFFIMAVSARESVKREKNMENSKSTSLNWRSALEIWSTGL